MPERIGPADWRDWKRLRLAALRDYPLGFLRSDDDAVAQPDEDWTGWLSRPGAFWLVRTPDPVAMCAAWEEDGRAWLGAVHVTPALRGQGLVEELVRVAAAWAREQGHDALHLEVHEDNARAQPAYARLGFVDTGARRPYPLDPGAAELEMVLALR